MAKYKCLCGYTQYFSKNKATEKIYFNENGKEYYREFVPHKRANPFRNFFCPECGRDVTTRVKAALGERAPVKSRKDLINGNVHGTKARLQAQE